MAVKHRSQTNALLVCALFAISTLAFSQELATPMNLPGSAVIPAGSKIYIAPLHDGYEVYLSAAIIKKQVPVIVVEDRMKADFEMTGVTETDRAGWAKMLFTGSQNSNEQASIKIVNLKTDAVVYGYNVHKTNSVRGKQSSAEACAKHLKEKIESQK